MKRNKALAYLKETSGWSLKGDTLVRDLKFKNFRQALKFTIGVGKIAEKEGHHPDILIYSWSRVKLILYTHSIKGLSENDFIIAAKVNELLKNKYDKLDATDNKRR